MSAATKFFFCLIAALASQVFIPWFANASERFIVVASTTSTENSGLYNFITGGKTIEARFSFVYSKNDTEWKIISHHSSVLPET